jgi:hypothetical protein
MNMGEGRRYRQEKDKERAELACGNSYVTKRMMRRKNEGKE